MLATDQKEHATTSLGSVFCDLPTLTWADLPLVRIPVDGAVNEDNVASIPLGGGGIVLLAIVAAAFTHSGPSNTKHNRPIVRNCELIVIRVLNYWRE